MAATCKKIGGLVTEALKEKQSEYHDLVAAADGKVWLVSLTGVEQPAFSYYHRTPLHGGYVALFEQGKWSDMGTFDAIDKDENREHELFALADGSLCMLVYSQYKKFQLHKLLKWTDGKWKDLELKGAPSVEVSAERLSVAPAPNAADPNTLHFVVSSSGSVAVFKLSLSSSGAAVTPVEVKVGLEPMFGQPNFHVVCAAVHKDTLYAIFGCEMCGFRWQADKLISIGMNDGSCKVVEVQGDSPPWSFGGPQVSLPLENGHWLMTGGSRAKGMTNTEPDHSIWALSLPDTKWQCIKGELPNSLDANGVAFGGCPKQKSVYAYAPESGLIQIAYSKA